MTVSAESGVPQHRISVAESGDMSQARFMESFESKHSDHSFTAQLGAAVGVSRPPLRLDSQAKYGKGTACTACIAYTACIVQLIVSG